MEEVYGHPLCLFSEAITNTGNLVVQDKPSRTGGMIINVFRDKTDQQPCFQIKTCMKDRKAVPMDKAFLALYYLDIQEDIAQHVEGFVVPICSEHKRGGIMFRLHPNYRGKGPCSRVRVLPNTSYYHPETDHYYMLINYCKLTCLKVSLVLLTNIYIN
jgi:hypothetical protein